MAQADSNHEHRPLDSAVHRALLTGLIEHGRVPTLAEMARELAQPDEPIRQSLARLEANHGVVLHPGTCEPWVVHPFSTTPTLFYVRGARHGWWSPCIWCGLGVATLVAEPVRIHTVLGGETEPCEITHADGAASPPDLLAHFPIPVARAWDNVHRHCACTLVFRNESSIDRWCDRHGIPRGAVLTLSQVADLARVWYGGHLAPDWRKATAAEARARFESVGLTGPHWALAQSTARF